MVSMADSLAVKNDHIECQVYEMLSEQRNLTDSILLQILSNDFAAEDCFDFTSTPSYGILIGLHYYSIKACRSLHYKKPNRVLKKLVDYLFPLCTISRADRLERKINSLLLKAQTVENLNEYLRTEWKPQATG